MVSTRMDDQLAALDHEDKAVLLVDADAPPADEVASQGFGLPDAVIAISLYARDERIDAFERTPIKTLPLKVLIPRKVMPKLFHARTPRSVHVHGSCEVRCRNRP